MGLIQAPSVVQTGVKKNRAAKVAITFSYNFQGDPAAMVNMNGIIRNASSYLFDQSSLGLQTNFGRIKCAQVTMLFLETTSNGPAGSLFVYVPSTRQLISLAAPVVTATSADYAQVCFTGIIPLTTQSGSKILFVKETDAEGGSVTGQLSVTLYNYNVPIFVVRS